MTRILPAAIAASTLALAALAGAPAPAAAQTGFEGVITFREYNKSDGTHSTMIQTSKGNKVRLDGMNGSKGSMILDGDAHSMIMIEPDEKKYMTITQADMDQMAAMMPADRSKNPRDPKNRDYKVDLKDTGRTETVAGTKCEIWHGSSTDEDGQKREGEACVAKGVGFEAYNIALNNPMAQRMRGSSMQRALEQYKKVLSGGKGVLKMTDIDNGKSIVEMEAVKIDPKSVSDTTFKPPAGYTGQSMGQMMQMQMQRMQMMKERMQKAQNKPSDKN
jgi:Domain of unknown function (DUF4412)